MIFEYQGSSFFVIKEFLKRCYINFYELFFLRIQHCKFYKISYIGFFVILLVFTTNTQAQGDSKSLTLVQALELGYKSNRQYQISLKDLEIARLKVRESWSALWPTLYSGASATKQDVESGMSANVKGSMSLTFVSASLKINPGVFYNSLKASRRGFIIAKKELINVRNTVAINILKAYYGVVLSEENVRLQRESLKVLKENYQSVLTGYRKGVLSRLDLLQAKVSFSNAKAGLLKAKSDLQTTGARLNVLLGRSIYTPVSIPWQRKRMTMELDFLSDFLSKELSKKNLTEQKKLDHSRVQELVKYSLAHRPELIQLREKRAMEENLARASQAVYLWPTFSLSGNYGSSKNISKSNSSNATDPATATFLSSLQSSFNPPGWINSWQITAAVTYTWGALSPLDKSHVQAYQGFTNAEKVEWQIKDLVENIKLEIQDNYNKLKSSIDVYDIQKENVLIADESLRSARTQFYRGLLDNSKLLDAEVALTKARTSLVQSIHDSHVAIAELAKATGRDPLVIVRKLRSGQMDIFLINKNNSKK